MDIPTINTNLPAGNRPSPHIRQYCRSSRGPLRPALRKFSAMRERPTHLIVINNSFHYDLEE
jgi:hypothetical protein